MNGSAIYSKNANLLICILVLMLSKGGIAKNMTDSFEQVELDGWTDEEDELLRKLVKKRLSVKRSKDHDLKFVSDILDGESSEKRLASILNGTVEVKTHKSVKKYGNVFIEVTDRGRPSGIMTSKAEWQAEVLEGEGYDGEVIILIKTHRLKNMVDGKYYIRGGDASTGAKIKLKELTDPYEEKQ